MEVEATVYFLKQYRKCRNRPKVRNELRLLKNKIKDSPNWFNEAVRLQNCAAPKTFRHKYEDERIVASHLPPLRFLDVAMRRDVYQSWSKGDTHASIQISRFENVAETPDWLNEIFKD